MGLRPALLAGLLLVASTAAPAAAQTELTVTEPVETTALAVARTPEGVQGASASISVSVAPNGSGHVFVETRPLAGTDMQGSARIAARVASSVTGYSFENHDFFYAIRSESPVISGPSAGGELALATVAALENAHREPGEPRWNVSEEAMATGTINPDGTIGPVGGILTKARAAAQAGAELFLVPENQDPYRPRIPAVVERYGAQPVNLTDYCHQELGITCREVGTIEQLVVAATGHRFEQPELGEPPTTSPYEPTLGPMSRDLVEEARGVYETWDRLNRSEEDPEAKRVVEASIRRSTTALQQAESALENERYYSAASRAFQASIQARQAQLLLTFFEKGRSLDHVETSVDRAADEVASARQAAANASVGGIQELYTIGAAQQRVSQAERHVQKARQALNVTDVEQALFQAAFAFERAETVRWWLSLADEFGPGEQLPRNVSSLSQEFIDLGDEMLAYTNSVAGRQGGSQAAAERLQQAKADDERGFHAAALLEAAEAQVLATLPLELRGQPPAEAVDESRREAIEAIQNARGRGVEPVLPVAMFEFGSAHEDPAKTTRLYRQARVLAGISSVLTGEANPTPSAFVGEPDPPELEEDEAASDRHAGDPETQAAHEGLDRTPEVGWFVAGFFAAIVVGIGTAALRRGGSGGKPG